MAPAPLVVDGRAPWLEGLGRRFAVRYALVAAALFAVYGFPFESFGASGDWLHGYLAGYAKLAGAVLATFDSSVRVEDTQILGRYPLAIVRNCDAADVHILFVSAVVALPGPWRRKVGPLMLGAALLAAVNVGRICSLYLIGVAFPSWFRVAHEEAWPLLLMALTVALFVGCARHLTTKESDS
jgi:exosortase/archaeosortase family protein